MLLLIPFRRRCIGAPCMEACGIKYNAAINCRVHVKAKAEVADHSSECSWT